MKECVFWDNEDNKFISWHEVVFTKDKGDDFVILMKEIDPICSSGRLYDSFNYIGLNDINNNKIYADCSIVEFTYEGDFKPVTLQGYFSFDDELLCYKINLLPKLDYGVNKLFYFEAKFKYRISGIKIIDTIQENKLGLTDGINL